MSGTVNGATLFVADAVVTQSASNGVDTLGLVMSASANACVSLGSPDALDSLTYLYVTVPLEASAAAPVTYSMASGDGGLGGVTAYFWKSGANCTQSEDIATSGSITFNVLTPDGATGTFSFDFPDGHFDGMFDAPTCTPVATSTTPCH